jgi:hypothetical protein
MADRRAPAVREPKPVRADAGRPIRNTSTALGRRLPHDELASAETLVHIEGPRGIT